MLKHKVTCICPTHGRFSKLSDSLACFLQQDCEDAEMLIYNFHEQPIKLRDQYKHVRLVNEPNAGDVSETWKRVLEFVTTEFIRLWLDDDLYLPWAVSQGLEYIGGHNIFKPQYFYHMVGATPETVTIDLARNVAEGSMTITTNHAREIILHETDGILSANVKVLDVSPSWVFRWGDGLCKSEGIPRDISRSERNTFWRMRNQDVGNGILAPADVSPYWNALLNKYGASDLKSLFKAGVEIPGSPMHP